MKLLIKIIFLGLFLFVMQEGYGQGKEKIKLERADVLRGGKKVNKFIGNVAFSHQGAMLYCDSAYQYPGRNSIEAFSNVRIVQGDTLTITGDRLVYNGDTRKAVMTGKTVYLRDKNVTLTTKYVEYDLNAKLAYYINGGTINDGETTLTSDRGYYSTDAKEFRFKKNVKVVNPAKNYELTSDTLHYNTITKIATFKGPSKIISSDGTIIADEGQYDTVKAQSVFEGKGSRAQVHTGSYKLTGDRIFYDEKIKAGVAKGNVRLISEEDKIIIEGDVANYWGSRGISKVYGHVLMKSLVNQDTLYLTADTLISIENKEDPSKKRLLAFNRTRIYKSDLQGKCDSLAYNFSDSTIYFYRDPVLWSDENQITADSINVLLVNKKINKMNMTLNSFIISQDTLLNYNQVKGKNMTAHFKDEGIYRVDVDGNGESIYFALEDLSVTGMNKVACSDMVIRFMDNKVNDISFIEKPDGKFIPPHEIKDPEKKLKGFQWRGKERPKLASFLLKK